MIFGQVFFPVWYSTGHKLKACRFYLFSHSIFEKIRQGTAHHTRTYFFATTATTTNNDDSGVANLLVMRKRHYHRDNKDNDGGVGGLLVMRKQKASDSPLARMQQGGGPRTLDGLFSDGGTLFASPPPSRLR